ncbi:MAG TPA: hypothetical protein VFV58_14810 [Blastocatellia bacterium]|nr:hypothetical protein [Blastocatellia bacterium]
MRVRRGLSALVCAALMMVAGCDNAEYRQQIATFQQSIGNTRSAVESYYLEMNQFERDIYFLRLELDKGKKLGIKFLKDSDRREVTEDLVVDGPFPREAIQARLDSISLLGLYGTRLAELAGAKAPSSKTERRRLPPQTNLSKPSTKDSKKPRMRFKKRPRPWRR